MGFQNTKDMGNNHSTRKGAGHTTGVSAPTNGGRFTFPELAHYAAFSTGMSSVLLGILQLIRGDGEKPSQSHPHICRALVRLMIMMMFAVFVAGMIRVIPGYTRELLFRWITYFIFVVSLVAVLLLVVLAL